MTDKPYHQLWKNPDPDSGDLLNTVSQSSTLLCLKWLGARPRSKTNKPGDISLPLPDLDSQNLSILQLQPAPQNHYLNMNSSWRALNKTALSLFSRTFMTNSLTHDRHCYPSMNQRAAVPQESRQLPLQNRQIYSNTWRPLSSCTETPDEQVAKIAADFQWHST